MAEDVAVTGVIVDYAFGGQAFRVVFANPGQIRSIIFNREELDRLKEAQKAATGNAVLEHRLEPTVPVSSAAANGEPTEAAGTRTGTSATIAAKDMGLWWHTSACTFFHPEKL